MLLETLRGNFNKINPVIANNILRAVEAMVKSSSSNTSTIVRELSKTYGTSFKTNDGTVESQIIFYFICHFWYKFLLFLAKYVEYVAKNSQNFSSKLAKN